MNYLTVEEKEHLIDMLERPEECQSIERGVARYLLLFGDENEELAHFARYLIDSPNHKEDGPNA